jgi:hypothetical protein
MENYTKTALTNFVEMSISKGWVNANTGGGIRAACKKILEQVASDDDVRQVDVAASVIQYSNRHPGELSPDSLRVYESRVNGAIEGFVKFVANPAGYTIPIKAAAARPKKTDARKPPSNTLWGEKTSTTELPPKVDVTPPSRLTVTESSLALPFPLRSNFLAQIVIPRDLSKAEAKRLCVFIESLAFDSAT